jgi:trimethylguanosine synthase
MGKRCGAPAAPRHRRRPTCAISFLCKTPLRFLRILGGATARKPTHRRRTAESASTARGVARPKEPKPADAAEEPHEKAVEARTADAAAAIAGKYWSHRHSLFSLYDCGVRMDAEGWYSATPEAVAASQAARATPRDLVVDAFAGCGGNSIQFAVRHANTFAVLFAHSTRAQY